MAPFWRIRPNLDLYHTALPFGIDSLLLVLILCNDITNYPFHLCTLNKVCEDTSSCYLIQTPDPLCAFYMKFLLLLEKSYLSLLNSFSLWLSVLEIFILFEVCLSYYSIVVKRHQCQGNLKIKSFNWSLLTVSAGKSMIFMAWNTAADRQAWCFSSSSQLAR